MSSQKNLRGFLQGVQFCLNVKGLRINVYDDRRKIMKNDLIKPNFSFDLDNFNLRVVFYNDQMARCLRVKLEMALNYVMMLDTCKQDYKRYTLNGREA